MKKRLFIKVLIICLFLFCFFVSPAPVGATPGCVTYNSTPIGGYGQLWWGPVSSLNPSFTAGDWFGYTFIVTSQNAVDVSLSYYDTSDVLHPNYHLFNSSAPFLLDQHGNAAGSYLFGGDFVLDVCPPNYLTPTVVATNTPTSVVTNTPTTVVITTTPVPATVTPVVSTEALLTTIRDTQDTQVKFFVFTSVVFLGVLVLSYVRLR